ncbi:protein disulfide isomerase [Chytriomyces sp. MP71]|nr:protein disulfide isomerase [Chytriomyces sp. MP71]
MRATLLTLLACVGLALASNVIDLTPSNFDKVIDGSKPALVEFYAPWCGHCKSLAPIYEELADAFVRDKNNVVIAKVDADAHKDLGSKFGVTGFPTLKWFPKGAKTPEDYSGGRELTDLAAFITQKTGLKSNIKKAVSYVTVLNTEEEFSKVVGTADKNVLVEFYAPWCGHCKSLAPIYEKVARDFATESKCIVANVDATVNKDVAEEHGVTGYPTIKFFAAGDSKGEKYEGGRTEADFVAFLNEKCGTDRKVGGGLGPKAGLVQAFNDVVDRFKAAKGPAKTEVMEEAKKVAKTISKNAYASYYGKVMEKIIKGGEGYIAKEVARLEKIIDSGTNTPEKQDNFEIRRNILKTFADKSVPLNDDDMDDEL